MTDAETTALIEEVATLKKQVSDKDDVITKFNDELTQLRNKVFGHTSEKHLPMDPVQLLLFDQKEMSDHLPFYCQIQQYKEAGITISDSTMGDWYEAAVERLGSCMTSFVSRYSKASISMWTRVPYRS